MTITHVSSRQNAWLKQLIRLAQNPSSYLQTGRIWLEGAHLCQAYRDKVGTPEIAVYSESSYHNLSVAALGAQCQQIYVLDDVLFAQISQLQSAAGIGFVIDRNTVEPTVQAHAPTVLLDRLQDPGNVGSILRSAAALGFHQVIAMQGTCALWAPKVLRAGMGAHFSLNILEQQKPELLGELLKLPLLGTSSHASQTLQQTSLPWPCAWVVGHEGQGMSDALLAACMQTVCIFQPGGEESLNAAIAASICMYESCRQQQL